MRIAYIAAAAVLLCSAPAVPALAQSQSGAKGNDQSAAKLVDSSAKVLQQTESNANFKELLAKAKGIFIIPDLIKGAAIIGGSGGTGVLVARNGAEWIGPAFFTLGSISIGAQAGGKAGPVFMFLMTDKAVNSFTQNNNFSLNGNANLTVANWSPNEQGSIGKGDVVVWSGTTGLFAGLDINGADIVADTGKDHAYYGNDQAGTKQIIEGHAKNPQAQNLLSALPG